MSARPAVVRYYVDADILGVGKELVRMRSDVTYPGDPGGTVYKRTRPPCPVERPDTLDPDWIPVTAAHQWLIITRDRHIQQRQAERDAVRNHGARMVALAGDDAKNTFAQLEVLMCNWRFVEGLLDQPGPFIYTITRTGVPQLIDLK